MDGCCKGPVVVAENVDDVLRETVKVVQKKLAEGKISESLSMLTLNKTPTE